eukprot:984853-Pyramimonas_sp.AAC.1
MSRTALTWALDASCDRKELTLVSQVPMRSHFFAASTKGEAVEPGKATLLASVSATEAVRWDAVQQPRRSAPESEHQQSNASTLLRPPGRRLRPCSQSWATRPRAARGTCRRRRRASRCRNPPARRSRSTPPAPRRRTERLR